MKTMKHYLALVPILAKTHKKQNRMSVICIFLAVFLVTAIFGMADMFIRSQVLKAKMDYGNWHVQLKYISEEDAHLISTRPEVKNLACYGTFNYRLDMGYTLGDRDVLICGSDENYATEIEIDMISEGSFPQSETEALVGENARSALDLSIGDTISVNAPDGTTHQYAISGFSKNSAMITKKDVYYIFLNTEGFRAIFPNPAGNDPASYNSIFMVQFHEYTNMRKAIAEIKESFSLSDGQVGENTMLLGLYGQSGSDFMMMIYGAALLLSMLVLLAGILMIASSLNSNVAGRTNDFGMLRCIGATPKQIIRLVHREAFFLCRRAIPLSILCACLLLWLLCALLRTLSPQYFGGMPVFGISIPSIVAGILIGMATVFLAARSPARKAARVSPLTAVTGRASELAPVRKAANTSFMKIDTALGIHHAKASRKNFLLVTGSFALSIILFLSFSVTIDFMKQAITPLSPWTPDLSVISTEYACDIDNEIFRSLQENQAVERIYGRMVAYNLPISIERKEAKKKETGNKEIESINTENKDAENNRTESNETSKHMTCDLISYEETQFSWAKKYLVEGSIDDVMKKPNTGCIVFAPSYEQNTAIQLGDTVTLHTNEKEAEIEITAIVSKCPFAASVGSAIIICSEETFRALTGEERYTIIDMQLTKNASELDVTAIRDIIGTTYAFSDERLDNDNVLGTYYSYSLFLYGFLLLIALITIFNIINCTGMSVSARMKQYGALRAIGLSHKQLSKMIVAQTCTYALTGSIIGAIIGIILNRIVFERLVAFRWGIAWEAPIAELAMILGVVAFSIILAIRAPLHKIREMSIVDTIHA